MRHHPPFATMTGRTLALVLLVASVASIAPVPATADAWVAEGLAIAPSDGAQSDAVLAADGHGGAFLAWQDHRSGGDAIFSQHVRADGTVAPGWPVGGMPLGASVDPVILADGLGGAFVAAADGYDVHLWHLSADGTLNVRSFASASEPPRPDLAPARGARPFDTDKVSPTVLPVLCSDGAGGAFLAWEQGGFLTTYVIVEHFLPGGGHDPAWPAGGAIAGLGRDTRAPVLCRDGGAGVFVGFLAPADSGFTLRALRFDARGVVAAGWPDAGLPVSSAAGGQDAPAIVSGDAGGALLLWEDTRTPGRARLLAQLVTADGSIAPGWPAAGRTVCSTPVIAGESRYSGRSGQLYTSAVNDGAGGAIVAWQDARADAGDVYAQHLLPDASLAPGWPADGLALSIAPGAQRLPSLAPDGSGGAFAAWQDERGNGLANVHAQHVSGSGVIAPGWADIGVALTATDAEQFLPRVVVDGAGGALVAWQDTDCGAAEIFASHVGADGSLPSAHGPAPVNVTALGASADSGQIRVSWQLASSGAPPGLAVVYCRQSDGPWSAVDTVAADAAGRVLYADRGAIAGCRYGYALGVTNCGRAQIQGVTWVDVPEGSGFLPLAVVTASVEPDSGRVRLAWRLNAGERLAAMVFERDSCSNWVHVGDATEDDSDLVSLVDTSPEYVGARRLYRLVVHACGADHELGAWRTAPLEGPGTVPLYASLTAAVADSGTAMLSWRLAFWPLGLSTLVERLDPIAGWIARGPVLFDRSGALLFRDTGLLPSHRYEYRLNLFVCEARTTLPSFAVVTGAAPDPRAELALLGVGPNPASGVVTVALSVPDGAPVRFEVLDAAGRSMLSRSVEPVDTQAQSIVLDGLGALRPGIYLLRVTQHGVSRSRRVVIVR